MLIEMAKTWEALAVARVEVGRTAETIRIKRILNQRAARSRSGFRSR
jgi:hypothetical protein